MADRLKRKPKICSLFLLKLNYQNVHTEKFWKENIKKFEENDFLLIRKLSDMLKSNNNQNVVIACYDLREFCRFHPFGKQYQRNWMLSKRL
ncbi:unnamed protein product [Paramecium sonneborni]|uniref:ATPase V1 complex subunit H C-terminal domain-containing protein n=1 Tax=Paramecium sonneborni TaxID=65129 RepID=A0A8S1QAG6_9CILI|nr:unnamed protein product [Paramecium sonneborni]